MKRYRAIDLGLFALILCGLEAAAHYAIALFPTEAFTLSVIIPVTLIVMMRWDGWCAIHAVAGGLVYSLLNGGGTSAVLAYTVGGALIVANLLWFRLVGKEQVRRSALLSIAFVITGFALMETGRACVAALLEGAELFGLWVRYMTTDALSAVMGVVIILIARRNDKNGSVFYDQKRYLFELAEEERKNA